MNEQGRCVFVANGQMQANQVRAFLEASGVASMLRAESLTKTHGLTLDGLGRVDVLVAEADEERARTLLASAETGEFQLDEDADVESS
ncbi:MAG: putative signal transducing protein [bacterium]